MSSEAFLPTHRPDAPSPRWRRADPSDPASAEARYPGSDAAALESLMAASGSASAPLELRRWLELAEAWYIARALHALRGNRSAAARALGIGRRTLYAKMQKLGIEPSWRPGALGSASER